jgi:CheY-like chemotaxis protein/HPt (histidine-containing phosphotransfer) domain-containing protein
MMGGRIWVESQVGVGSQFHFTVRVGTVATPHVVIESSTAPVSLRGVKVLIVDDNRTNRRILEGLVRRWGMNSTLASDGEKALVELAKANDTNQPFDLILTDMHMPKMDGFSLVEQIKENPGPSTATIMMLTSGGQRGDAARCGELGIAAYLLKPVRQAELRDAIVKVLTTKEQVGASSMITRDTLHETADPKKDLHILLAEDNVVNQKLAIRLLEKRGHHVVLACNGKEALAALEKGSFDLVLMDVQMPEMDGLEATTALREREQATGRHQPIVAMTALAMKGDRERCIAAGMDSYLSKPIRPQQLDAMLDSYLATERKERPAPQPSVAAQDCVREDELLERIDGDRVFLAELVELFRADYPEQIRKSREAVVNDDALALQRAVHGLKGALKNLAAPIAADLAAELEAMGKSGDIAFAASRMMELEAEIVRAVDALEALCMEAAK